MLRHLVVVLGFCVAIACLIPSSGFALDAQKKNTQETAQELVGAGATSLEAEPTEFAKALLRLPVAAALGAALAFRPRRKSQGQRVVVVMQTQIMLAVVGAVIMLVVGNSLSRAFGIVGAAGLIRYRSSIADPKDAVVMLCSLAAGLAVGVELYQIAIVATAFMVALLYLVELFEPPAQKRFELKATTQAAEDFRTSLEDVLNGLKLEYDLLEEAQDELRYVVTLPLTMRTRDVSDTLRLVRGAPVIIRWTEKRLRN